MSTCPLEINLSRMEKLANLKLTIEEHLCDRMDTSRMKASWKRAVADIEPVLIAEALAVTMDKVRRDTQQKRR